MSFDQDPNEQAQISGADFAAMCDEFKALRKQYDNLVSEYDCLETEKETLEDEFTDQQSELRKLRNFLSMEGYRRCDIPACNCGLYHGGNAMRRLTEVREALHEAGLSTNGKTILSTLREHLKLEPLP
jgi:hypothetical protein